MTQANISQKTEITKMETVAQDNFISIDDGDWLRVVEESKIRPVIVDIWAPWCKSCERAGKSYDIIAARNQDMPVTFIKYNV